eukprot:g585.t1
MSMSTRKRKETSSSSSSRRDVGRGKKRVCESSRGTGAEGGIIEDPGGNVPLILFVGNARGNMNGEDGNGRVTHPLTSQRANLSQHGYVVGPVRSLTGGRLTGASGAILSRVIALRKAIDDLRKKYPSRPIFVASQSSGCRIAAHTFAGQWMTKPKRDGSCQRFSLGTVPAEGEASRRTIESATALYAEYPEFSSKAIPRDVAGVMLFGYPLKHETQDRTPPLQNMHRSVHVLFVSGDRDPFNCRLEEAVRKCRANATFARIKGGRHDVWSPYDEKRHASIHSAIHTFMKKCLESD